ncbi:hypothetical protein MgSA37_03216 [Mucilaginibacter gotjawali]|uniref:Uncharacterized protein n=2 Tax=Mucilaginibacter gotjawali TaxID=1550579 RepID=A0A839SDN6_9SPHI|nr:hypothetical protein [Mucilaginibacter gotjawali]BAU55035.1 hypothetical protein MgSA37_03216 [Mucilaginibacter gotjawali]
MFLHGIEKGIKGKYNDHTITYKLLKSKGRDHIIPLKKRSLFVRHARLKPAIAQYQPF